jgi:hypothetical protein
MNRITTHQNESSTRAAWVRGCVVAGLVAAGVIMIGRSPQAATGTLVPALYQTVLDANGNPISGAKVCTYLAGTTTPTPTYTDVALTVPNSNPIVTDTAGRWSAFLTPANSYKFVLQDATGTAGVCNGAIVRTIDNVSGTPAAQAVITGTWFPSLGGSTTYTAREGTYVRTGALVVARGTLTVGAIGTGSPTFVAGLPFPISGDTVGAIVVTGPAAAPYTRASLLALNGAAQFGVVGSAAASASDAYLSFFANGTGVYFTLTYQTLAP